LGKGLRIFAIVVGILLLLPGACFSILGIAVGGQEGPTLILIGVLILAVAIGLFVAARSRPKG
jgi:hypothetical protein